MSNKINIYVGNELNYIIENIRINCYKLYIHSIVGDSLIGTFKSINEVENEINYRRREYSKQMEIERMRRSKSNLYIRL